MQFSSVSKASKRPAADLLILPFWQDKKKARSAISLQEWSSADLGPLKAGDFKGAEGECALCYLSGEKEPRVLLLGLGKLEECSVEMLRRAYSAAAKLCQSKCCKKISLVLPEISEGEELSIDDVARGVAEGLLLPNYTFDKFKSKKDNGEERALIQKAVFIEASRSAVAAAKRAALVFEGVYLARDLVNNNADEVTPQYFAALAKSMAGQFKSMKATVFDRKRLEKEKMGLILAVGRGAIHDPSLVILEYKGAPKSKESTVFVGKGVTFDTGGLNLKPTGSIETMKCDMGGAAAVFGAVYVAAKLGLKVNVTGVVPTAENAVDSHAYKVGDVYTSYSGETVEIGNTDAEGRLILADALAYTRAKLKPSRIIDLATLTGACVVALGEEASGLMSNDDGLAHSLMESGERTFERCWRLPNYKEYRKKLESPIADLKNVGGRGGGTITAGLFLQHFVGEIPWAHLDIAGTAYLDKPLRYQPAHATGVGVRLLIDFLERQKS